MEDHLPAAVAGLPQHVAPEPVEPPALDVQSVMEAADLAHHRIRRSIHAVTRASHRMVVFFARHQGAVDSAQLERGRDEAQLRMYSMRGMR